MNRYEQDSAANHSETGLQKMMGTPLQPMRPRGKPQVAAQSAPAAPPQPLPSQELEGPETFVEEEARKPQKGKKERKRAKRAKEPPAPKAAPAPIVEDEEERRKRIARYHRGRDVDYSDIFSDFDEDLDADGAYTADQVTAFDAAGDQTNIDVALDMPKPQRPQLPEEPDYPEDDEEWDDEWDEDLMGHITLSDLEQELRRSREERDITGSIKAVLVSMLCVAAAVLVIINLLPVMRVYGNSMDSTLQSGDIVLAWTTDTYAQGDIIAFQYGTRTLLRRIIGTSGDEVDINNEGKVFVNNRALREPYVSEPTHGEGTLDFPKTIESRQYFVLGDNRREAVDSRHEALGDVDSDQVLGKVIFRIWPLTRFGALNETAGRE